MNTQRPQTNQDQDSLAYVRRQESQPRLVPSKRAKALFKAAKYGLAFSVGVGSGLVAADYIGAPHPVESVVITYGQPDINPDNGTGYADDLTSVTRRGIEELGVTGQVSDVINETTGTPDPGEQVRVTEMKSPIFGRTIIKTENED